MTNIFAKHESDLAVVADLARPDILKFGDNGIAYNGNIRLGDIDSFLDARTRKRGTFSTDDLTSFSEFVEVHGTAANTKIFIDKSAMEAMAVLNFGDDNYPMGHCDFCAVLTAKPTKVYEKSQTYIIMGVSAKKILRYSWKIGAVSLSLWTKTAKRYR